MARRDVALDHNIPLPILDVLDQFVPEVRLVPVQRIDAALAELDDHELIYELGRREWSMLVTGNYKMLYDASVLVALHQTKLTLMALERAGDDAILATGALLRDLLPVIRKLTAKGQVFRSRPVAPRSESPYGLLQHLAGRQERQADELLATLKVQNWRQG